MNGGEISPNRLFLKKSLGGGKGVESAFETVAEEHGHSSAAFQVQPTGGDVVPGLFASHGKWKTGVVE